MPFTIPDWSEAALSEGQAGLYQTDIDVLVAGIGGDGVLVGCAVAAQGTPNNTVAVASGEVRVGGVNVPVTGANVTMPTADATNPRWVLISVNSSGTLTATAGTPAPVTTTSQPLLPDVPANSIVLAAVWWPAADTTVANDQITDKRVVIVRAPGDGRATSSGGTTYIGVPGIEFSVTSGTRAMVNNRIHYAPMLVSSALTVDQLLCEITTAASAGATARMGIYRADANWQPTSLVVDAGTVAIDTTGVKTAAVSATLQPGRYVTAYNSSTSHTIRVYRGGSRYVGLSAAMGSAAFVAIMYAAQAFAAFPSTGLAWDTVATQSSPFDHMVFCRASAA